MSRYSIYKKSDHEYYFNVEECKDLQYKVFFGAASHLLPHTLANIDLFEISFSKIGKDKNTDSRIGNRIRATIIFTIVYFIQKNKNCPLIFICESLDNLQEARLKLFVRWFLKSEHNEHFRFFPKQLTTDFDSYFVGLFLPHSHSRFEELTKEFENPQILDQKS